MRPIELLLSLANLLAFSVLAVPRLRKVRALRYSVLVTLPIAGAQMLVEGPRWQMIPAYALSGLLFLAWSRQGDRLAGKVGNRSAAKRLTGVLGIGLGALGLIVSSALPLLFPVFRFPKPSGPYEIGTLTYHWVDTARPEIFTEDPNDRRELIVQIWYPAKGNPSSPRASYVQDPRVLSSLARMLPLPGFHLPGFTFDHWKYIRTNAIPAAPVADGEPTYPVLLFSPGRGGFRQDNTYQIEKLVSHGYIVAAVDHPYASSGVEFPDGRLVTLDSRLLPGPPPQRALFVDRKFFDDVALPFLAQDIIFTLDQLTALNKSDPNGILTTRLDLQRAGMYGPSLGGLIGAEACYLEPRLRALLAMDVHMPVDVVRDGLKQPTMFISREVKWMQLEGWTPEYLDETQTTMRVVFENLSADGYMVLIAGTFHANFSDGPYVFGPLSSQIGVTGPIDRNRANNIIGAYTLAFFDKHLKGLPTTLLDGPSERYPEVLFETHQTKGKQTRDLGNSLANTSWRLVSLVQPGAETLVMEDSTITLEFDAEKRASGAGSCNFYDTQYEVQGNKLSFGEITRTMMACEQEGIGRQEQSYFQALESVGKYELDDEHLMVWSNDGKTVLNFVKR